MKPLWNALARMSALLAASAAVLLCATVGLADKLHLKDGRVLDGTVVREESGIVVFKFTVNGQTKEEFFTSDEIDKVEKESRPAEPKADKPAPTTPPAAKPAETKPADAKPTDLAPATAPATGDKKNEARSIAGRATRIAVLNFGPPAEWQGKHGDMVGTVVNAKSWREAIPLLEKDNVDVVAVRINSDGGMLREVDFFHQTFDEYQKKFRTVMWVESAISAAIMSPWPIEEIYVMPQGTLGGATAWFGSGTAVSGIDLEGILHQGEVSSRKAKRDPAIMRSMQIEDALSCNIDDNGNITWFQDESGKYLVKPKGRVLTLTANEAIKYGVAKAKAATVAELADAMGIKEWELAGQAASKFIDDNMRTVDTADKKLSEVLEKYNIAAGAGASLPRERRAAEVGRARQFLTQIKRWIDVNPTLGLMRNIDDAWFDQQEQRLKEMLR